MLTCTVGDWAMRTLWLASTSPRRKQLLEDAGFSPTCVGSKLDDDLLRFNEPSALGICAARAWFKALGVHRSLCDQGGDEPGDPGVLLAADTLCERDGHVLGKPADRTHAERMLRGLIGASHRTVTGVALLDRSSMSRSIWCDVADVHVGAIDEQMLDEYLDSGDWRGKSGGYNLVDRQDAGWPVVCDGDPSTVMGLPIRRLRPQIERMLGGEA